MLVLLAVLASGCSDLAGECLQDGCSSDPVQVPVACVPAESGAVVGDGCGVFVSSSLGDDELGDGSKAAPFGSVARALNAGASNLYLCLDGFAEAVTVSAGTNLFGGLDCGAGWSYRPGERSGIVGPADQIALTVSGAGDSRIEDVAVTAASATLPGGSSIAVLVDGSGVDFARCDLTAGDGAAGAAGVEPSTAAASGGAGSPGLWSSCALATSGSPGGGGGVAPSCANGLVAGGGGDGGAGSDGTFGVAGQPGGPATIGGSGTSGAASGQTCVAVAGVGANGNDGGAAAASEQRGTINASGYVGAPGLAGQPGAPGRGGGGGGGGGACVPDANHGPGGGGGGSGGCGGLGGAGGQAGGASIALAGVEASIVLHDCELVAGIAGAGGDGARGQSGGAGGSPGMASSLACDGAYGGFGGAGGLDR